MSVPDNPKEMLAMIITGIIIIYLLSTSILGIYLWKNRKQIMAKYEIDYLGSFFFSAFALMPFMVGIPSLFFNDGTIEKLAPFFGSFIYVIFPICVAGFSSKGKGHKISRMFVMLAYMLTFHSQLVCIYFSYVKRKAEYEIKYGSSTKTTQASVTNNYNTSTVPKSEQNDFDRNLYDSNGKYVGYINRHGQRYNSDGKYIGYVNEHGQYYDESGKYTGYVNEHGQKYNADGKYRGYIDKDGHNYDESGKFKGYSSK